MSSEWRGLLLDFYGTLVEEDTEVISAIVRRVVDASPIAARPDEVAASWAERFSALCSASHGGDFRCQRELEQQSLRDLLVQYECDLDPVEASSDLLDYWENPRPLPGALHFLENVRVPFCLVSNIDTEDLTAALGALGWDFPHLVTSQTCRAYKPRIEPFAAGLSTLGCAPSEALHVGDSIGSDIVGASAAGIAVAWVNPRGRSLPAGISTPQFDVSDVAGVLDLLA